MAEQLLAGVARATSGLPEDHTALVFGDRRTSFTELDSRANKVANGLLSLGATDQEQWQFSITAVISSMKSGLVPLVPIWL